MKDKGLYLLMVFTFRVQKFMQTYFLHTVKFAGRDHITHTCTGHHIAVFVDSRLHVADKGFQDFCVWTSSKVVDVSECFMAVITQRAFSTVIMTAVGTKQSWVIRVRTSPGDQPDMMAFIQCERGEWHILTKVVTVSAEDLARYHKI